MAQGERMAVLNAFIDGKFPVLVATGIAGRGLDLVNVTQVVNFDPPATIDGTSLRAASQPWCSVTRRRESRDSLCGEPEYVHRAGRAGRRGCGGECITCVATAAGTLGSVTSTNAAVTVCASLLAGS